MGEGQWWEPTVKNDLDVAIRIADFELQYGKCYDIGEHQCLISLVFTEEAFFQPTHITRPVAPMGLLSNPDRASRSALVAEQALLLARRALLTL